MRATFKFIVKPNWSIAEILEINYIQTIPERDYGITYNYEEANELVEAIEPKGAWKSMMADDGIPVVTNNKYGSIDYV